MRQISFDRLRRRDRLTECMFSACCVLIYRGGDRLEETGDKRCGVALDHGDGMAFVQYLLQV